MTYSPSVSSATDFAANPDNYLEVFTSLQAGDTLSLAGGTYTSGLDIHELNGYAGNWITIRGPIVGEPARFIGRGGFSTVTIKDSSYVKLIGLHIIGDDTNTNHGIELLAESQSAHNITIQELSISGFNQTATNSAIITKSPTWDWEIRLNVIANVGTGLSLGNKDQSSQFIRGIIEQNVILQSYAYGIFIGQQNGRPQINGVPRQTSIIHIRDNVLSKSQTPREGITGQPLMLLERQSETGFSESDSYEIYRNVFYENIFVDQPLVLASGNIRFHNNILVNSYGSGAHFGTSTEALRELECFNNTVLARTAGVRIENENIGFEQRVLGNAIFAKDPVHNPNGYTENNLADTFVNSSEFLTDPDNLEFYPKNGQLQGPPIDLEYYDYLNDYNLDFNGTGRPGSTRGAYVDEGENLGWKIHLARKNHDYQSTQDAGVSDAIMTEQPDSGDLVSGQMDAGLKQEDARAQTTTSKENCNCRSSFERSERDWPSLVLLLLVVIFYGKRNSGRIITKPRNLT